MSKVRKTLEKTLRGNADANIPFGDLCALLLRLGFVERTRGDHHIFTRDGVVEILNLQPRGGRAKPYQVKQVRAVITAYGLTSELEANDREPDGSSGAPEESQKHLEGNNGK